MKYLSYPERKIIEKMLKERSKIREIARVLNRSHSTISYEIKFNKNQYVKEYNAYTAHERFLKRQNNKGNKSKVVELELEFTGFLYGWIDYCFRCCL